MTRTTSVNERKQKYSKPAKLKSAANVSVVDYKTENNRIINCVDEFELYNIKQINEQHEKSTNAESSKSSVADENINEFRTAHHSISGFLL